MNVLTAPSFSLPLAAFPLSFEHTTFVPARPTGKEDDDKKAATEKAYACDEVMRVCERFGGSRRVSLRSRPLFFSD